MTCVGDVLNFVREYQHSCSSLNKCSVFMKRPFKRRERGWMDVYSFCNGQDSKAICHELDCLVDKSKRNTCCSIGLVNCYEICKNKILLRLNRSVIIKSVFLEISERKSAYGKSNVFLNKSYKMCCAQYGNSLTQLRVSVAARVLTELVRSGRGTVSDDGVDVIHLSQTGSQSIIVAPAKVTSAPNMLVEDYIRTRTQDIMVMGDHKDMSQQSIDQLVNSTVTFDLLSIKLEKPLNLDMSLQPTAARKSNNKGAPFVLYNYARLCAILDKFDSCVTTNLFPPLSSLEDINYSLYAEEDEWSLVFDLLAEWPAVVAEGQDLSSPGLHRLTGFLAALASTFSVYYRHTRVLNEGLAHMLPLLAARIHLLLAIKQVFANVLSSRPFELLQEGLAHMLPLLAARIHLLLAIRQVFANVLSSRPFELLQEGLAHMLPLLAARIHLLLAIRQVFANAFSLLGIVAPTTM